jgi:lysophospholipase L1-like esterase
VTITGIAPGTDAGKLRIPSDLSKGSRTIALGDSITYANSGASFFGGDSYFTQACALSGGRIRPLANAGVPGEELGQMLARVTTDVVAKRPPRVILVGGTNDVGHGVATATSMKHVREIAAILRGNGIDLTLATIPPNDIDALRSAQ